MHSAYRLFSWYGLGAEELRAAEITSRESARKLGPFVDEARQRLVLWRRASFDPDTGQRVRRCHFAHFPRGHSGGSDRATSVDFDPESYDQARKKNSKHARARDVIVDVLREMMASGSPASWAFVDDRVSEFSLTGNLLDGVVKVVPEFSFPTPFGRRYQFDVALLGEAVGQNPIVLGAVEIEFSHEFDVLKCLLCKSLGFPLLSVDVTEVDEADISKEWCMSALLGTSATDAGGRRHNYVYLHEMLYPLYMNVPLDLCPERRHQYVVFVRDDQFDKTVKWLKKLKTRIGIAPQDPAVLVQTVNASSEQAKKVLENEGGIAGRNWREYNDHRCIRVVLDRPIEKRGKVYLFHLLMARLLNGHCDALVGYKYAPTVSNHDPAEPLWRPYSSARKDFVPLLQKQVGQPVTTIFRELSKITK